MFTIKPTNSASVTGPTQRGIFAYGNLGSSTYFNMSNLIN